MKAIFYLLMSVAIAPGGVLPGRALYDCAMTGKRDQPACCCRARLLSQATAPVLSQATAPVVACPSCASCGPGAAATVRERTGRDREVAVLRAACCSVTHEKSALRHAAPAAAEGSWKASLEGARLAAALPPWTAALPVESSGRAPRGLHPPSLPGAWGAPLFILHCSLAL